MFSSLWQFLAARRAKHRLAIAVSVALVFAAGLVALCSYLDNTIVLCDDGKGLKNHYGIWAIFLGSPALVLLASLARIKFLQTLQALNKYTIGGDIPHDLRFKIDESLASLDLKRKTRFILLLFIVTGWYCWLLNVIQTIYPFDSYGNDVFDAYPHWLGFLSFKIYLLILWVFVYPFLSFLVLHIFFSMLSILKRMSEQALFKLDFFHEDNCGGVSIFGTINALLLSMTAIVFATVLAILFTHKGNYYSIWSSVVISFVLIFVQSIFGVYYIHAFVQQKKHDVLDAVNRRLNQSLLTTGSSKHFPEDLLALRNHLASIRSFPYTRGVRFAVNALRFAPAVAGLLHVVRGS